MAKQGGGIYSFSCEKCEDRFSQFCWDSDVDKQHCPTCDTVGKRVDDEPKSTAGFRQVQYSRALGVPVEQIEEAKRMFPHHEFAPDGRMIFENAQQLDRVKKDLGFEHF